MKKIVALGTAVVLAAGATLAAEPSANLNIADFTGNADVKWGVDLDAGRTGFLNSEYLKFKINLFDGGSKTTSQEGDVWAELIMSAGNTKDWTHHLFSVETTNTFNSTEDSVNGIVTNPTDGAGRGMSFAIDAAKIHFGDMYVSILAGDTVTGEYEFDGAVRGKGYWKGQGKWLTNVGPSGYSQGLEAGYANSNLGAALDFRSYGKNKNQYSDAYAVAAEVKLKDSNEWLSGLFADIGGSVNISNYVYDNIQGKAIATMVTQDSNGFTAEKVRTIGYSANAGYKLDIGDKYWLKPAVGFTGTFQTGKLGWDTKDEAYIGSANINSNRLVVGAMFGWSNSQADYSDLYYFGEETGETDKEDYAAKVQGGASVVAYIPLPETASAEASGYKGTLVNYDKVLALIVPSFYTKSDLVQGLHAGVYSEIALLRAEEDSDVSVSEKTSKSVLKNGAADKDNAFAFALAGAVAYDIKADSMTITPQVGARFANAAYFDNQINGYAPLNNNNAGFFGGQYTDMGIQKKKENGLYDGNFLNVKAGVNVNGLINNTDFYVVYQSANLLNQYDNDDGFGNKFYNFKAGTLNVGCTIAF